MWLLISTKKQLFKLLRIENEESSDFSDNRDSSLVVSENNPVTFLSADEALELSIKNCPFASREEIDEEMRKTCSRGERKARFYRKRIDKATKQELIDKGHKVEEGELEKAPFFYVIW